MVDKTLKPFYNGSCEGLSTATKMVDKVEKQPKKEKIMTYIEIERRLPKGYNLARIYRAFEGDTRVIAVDPGGKEHRFTVTQNGELKEMS